MFDAIQKSLYECDIFEEQVGKQMKYSAPCSRTAMPS
jgi:hypothetical protein